MDVSHIFRSYDVRGIYGNDLTEEVAEKIGATLAEYISKEQSSLRSQKTESLLQIKKDIVLAHDGRVSSPSLCKAFAKGFLSSGLNIEFVGMMPLGVGMFYAWKNKKEFAYITASHLPKEWNGIKFFHSSGLGFQEQENYKIRDIFNNIKLGNDKGKLTEIESETVISEYIKEICEKIKIDNKVKVVIDSGNGMASLAAKRLFVAIGCDVEELYGSVDGTFPNRNPEPGEDELTLLKEKSKNASIGIAYDGDGDRMLLVDNEGNKLSVEKTSYLILKEAIKEKGPIIANVECTMLMDDVAKNCEKNLIRVPVGHTFLVNEAQKNNACFGVETAGHYVLPFLFPFDDSLAISAFTVSVLSKQKKKLSDIVKEINHYPFARINFDCDDKKKFKVIDNLKTKLKQEYKINDLDGIRIDFNDGWVLIRPSNTGPLIRATIEGKTEKAFERIKIEFEEIVKKEINSI